MRITLPSGRRLAYPEAHFVPGKFPGTVQIAFKDNARGGWAEVTAWYGTFTENVVQATARDLLAAAMLRIEGDFPIVLHVHDECVVEVPEAAADLSKFHQLLTAAPTWATGLPIAAKISIRTAL